MNFKLCEIVQQTKYIDIFNAKKVLDDTPAIRDYAFILHDKDTDVEAHYHIAIRFKDSTDLNQIARWFDIPPQCISKVKGRWSDMLKYLTHRNRPNKYQYLDEEVVSNFDWTFAREVGSDTVKKNIIDGIMTGEIREYNYFNYITAVEYDKYKKTIETTYKYRSDMLKGVSRSMECIFITGQAGFGKTTYAKDLAKKKNYSVFVSSGSNDILDGYQGQDCIILDDLRPSCLGLSDLLKMLDNNTSSTVKSRYKNKVLECKLIIITTVLNLDTFYKNVFETDNEPIIQFKRRCKTYIVMHKDTIDVSIYNPNTFDYMFLLSCDNPIRFSFNNEFNEDIAFEYAKNLLGSDLQNIVLSDKKNDFVECVQQELPFE